MANNLTNLHKKLDRLTERLGAPDTRTMMEQPRSEAQMRIMRQFVNAIAAP
jgi:hypothetical protein